MFFIGYGPKSADGFLVHFIIIESDSGRSVYDQPVTLWPQSAVFKKPRAYMSYYGGWRQVQGKMKSEETDFLTKF